MGSNGLPSARPDLLGGAVGERYPESYDTGMPQGLAYSGSYGILDPVPAQYTEVIGAQEMEKMDMGRLALSPTRTYAPIVTRVFREIGRKHIGGMIHCTGGAQTKVLHFAAAGGLHIIKDNLLPIPPLFELIEQQSGTPRREMYQVFNMGHRLEFYVHSSVAGDIIALSRELGVEAQIIGRVEALSGGDTYAPPTVLTITDHKGSYEYGKS